MINHLLAFYIFYLIMITSLNFNMQKKLIFKNLNIIYELAIDCMYHIYLTLEV